MIYEHKSAVMVIPQLSRTTHYYNPRLTAQFATVFTVVDNHDLDHLATLSMGDDDMVRLGVLGVLSLFLCELGAA